MHLLLCEGSVLSLPIEIMDANIEHEEDYCDLTIADVDVSVLKFINVV